MWVGSTIPYMKTGPSRAYNKSVLKLFKLPVQGCKSDFFFKSWLPQILGTKKQGGVDLVSHVIFAPAPDPHLSHWRCV